MRFICAVLFASVLLFGCGRYASTEAGKEITTSETEVLTPSDEEVIYDVLLNEHYDVEHESYVVSVQMTSDRLPFNDLRESVMALKNFSTVELSDELLNDFVERNSVSGNLPSLQQRRNVKFVTKDELKHIFKGGTDGWMEFHKRFPKASLVNFSRIAFGQDRSEALVYTSQSGGPRSGHSNYVLLKKTAGIWKIESVINTWVS